MSSNNVNPHPTTTAAQIDPPYQMWSRSPVCVHIETAFVGKQRLLNDMIALPPGFRHRWISLKTFVQRSNLVKSIDEETWGSRHPCTSRGLFK